MFYWTETIPAAKDGDAYVMRLILHDWNDSDTVTILSNLRKAIGTAKATLLLVEVCLPPTFLFDMPLLPTPFLFQAGPNPFPFHARPFPFLLHVPHHTLSSLSSSTCPTHPGPYGSHGHPRAPPHLLTSRHFPCPPGGRSVASRKLQSSG